MQQIGQPVPSIFQEFAPDAALTSAPCVDAILPVVRPSFTATSALAIVQELVAAVAGPGVRGCVPAMHIASTHVHFHDECTCDSDAWMAEIRTILTLTMLVFLTAGGDASQRLA